MTRCVPCVEKKLRRMIKQRDLEIKRLEEDRRHQWPEVTIRNSDLKAENQRLKEDLEKAQVMQTLQGLLE